MFGFVGSSGGVGGEDAADFVADAAEDSHLFFIGSGGMGGVVEAPVVAVALAWEQRAGLVGIPAHGDDGFHVVAEELVEVFRMVAADVDADFRHGPDGERVDVAGWFGSCAGDLPCWPEGVLEDAFGEMGTAGIACAEDEDDRWLHDGVLVVAAGDVSRCRGMARRAPAVGAAR